MQTAMPKIQVPRLPRNGTGRLSGDYLTLPFFKPYGNLRPGSARSGQVFFAMRTIITTSAMGGVRLPRVFPSRGGLRFVPTICKRAHSTKRFIRCCCCSNGLGTLGHGIVHLGIRTEGLSEHRFQVCIIGLYSFVGSELHYFRPVTSSTSAPRRLPPRGSGRGLDTAPILHIQGINRVEGTFGSFVTRGRGSLHQSAVHDCSSFIAVFNN